ncbi:MAG: hypothetical protein EZS28_028514, partial [Streblomastix strix]
MQAHNYQQQPELAHSRPTEGSPELQPEQGEAQDVRAEKGRKIRDIVRNAILQSRPFAQRIGQDTQIGLQNEEII